MSYPTGGRGGSDHFANIQSLNALPTDFQDPVEPDLSLFTNTEFLDWDVSNDAHQQFDPLSAQPSDGGFNGNFNFNDISFSQAQPQLQAQDAKPWTGIADSASPTAASANTSQPPPSRRRNDSSAQNNASAPADDEQTGDALDVSAEEDKRRRNTAASARFRVKKKQREQAMEKTAKEMTERVAQLEAKVGELEKENKLLKNLLTEKSDGESSRKRAKTEIAT